MESTTYLLKDSKGKDHAIFTGDTLFLGDVGRPDLSQISDDMTTEDLAGIQFDSLRNKTLDPNLKLSRSQAVTYLVNEKITKLNGKLHGKNKA